MLLEKVLLLSHQHCGLSFRLAEEAMRSLARIDGQAGHLLVKLAARSCNVLAEILELQFAKILDHEFELVHVADVFVINTITGVEPIGQRCST